MGLLNDAGSFAATLARLGRGLYAKVTDAEREGPAKLLELYDYEGCPYCRKVREVLCELDLDYLSHPVAHGSPRRAELKRLGGRIQVPFLVDPNTATRMYESDDIIDYLNETYGGGRRAGWTIPVPSLIDDIDSGLASAVRLARGTRCREAGARADLDPLTLYNMEGSPYCRKVREVLTELDLEYVVKNMPKGSPKRAELVERGGKFQVPYLIDPNGKTEMYESDDIVAHLKESYAEPRAKKRKARSRAGAGR